MIPRIPAGTRERARQVEGVNPFDSKPTVCVAWDEFQTRGMSTFLAPAM